LRRVTGGTGERAAKARRAQRLANSFSILGAAETAPRGNSAADLVVVSARPDAPCAPKSLATLGGSWRLGDKSAPRRRYSDGEARLHRRARGEAGPSDGLDGERARLQWAHPIKSNRGCAVRGALKSHQLWTNPCRGASCSGRVATYCARNVGRAGRRTPRVNSEQVRESGGSEARRRADRRGRRARRASSRWRERRRERDGPRAGSSARGSATWRRRDVHFGKVSDSPVARG
jgi:hypothetical protein